MYPHAVADLGGDGGSQGFDPLYIFEIFNFGWLTDLKIFLKAPIYTNFEGYRAPKKRDFLVEIFQKLPKNAFFGRSFQKMTAARKKMWSK